MTVETFDRLVIIYNPASTEINSAHIQSQLEELQTHYRGYYVVEHTLPEDAENSDMLASTIRPGDLICAVGGDNTIGRIGTFLARAAYQDQGIILAPFGAGNKNDFARSVNGSLEQHSMLEVVQSGGDGPVLPIEMTILLQGRDPLTKKAMNCIGVGGSADIAYAVNQPDYRLAAKGSPLQRFTADAKVLASAIKQLKPFDIHQPERPNRIESRYEVTLTNSTRMGGYGKLPTHASDPRLYRLELTSRRPREIVRVLGSLLLGVHPKEDTHYIHRDETYDFTVSNTDGVLAHIDGDHLQQNDEPLQLKDGDKVSFRQSTYPVQVRQMYPYLPQAA